MKRQSVNSPPRIPSSAPPTKSPAKKWQFAALLIGTLLVGHASAEVIEWNFATATPTSASVPNLAEPTVSQYNNNGTTALITTTSVSSGYTGASGTSNAGAAARAGALNTGASGSAAFEFTLAPAATYSVSLTEISFGSRSTSTGPKAYSLRSSADGYVSDIATGTLSSSGLWALKTNSGLSFSSSSPVTLRLFGHSGTGSPGANTANWRIDDLKLTVSVSVAAPDTTPPTIATLSPANGVTGVAVDSNLVVSFSEAVSPIAGGILALKRLSDDSVVESFPLPSAGVVSSGVQVTINPTADLELGVGYYVEIGAAAFEDAAGNDFTGFSGSSTWSFTAIPPDTTPPTVTTIIPGTGATGVALKPLIELTYSELISPSATGLIFIKRTSDDSTVATFDINDPLQVSIFNNEVTLFLSTALPHNTSLYLDIPEGTFADVSPNENASTAYTSGFTTVDVPTLLETPAYMQGFTGFSADAPALPLGWSLTGPVTGFNTVGQQIWGEGVNSGLRGGANLLGYQHTGSTEILIKTLTLVNGTGATLTDLTVGYTGKAERTGELRSPAYQVSVAGTVVASLGYSTSSPDGTVLSVSVSGLDIPDGATFEITWTSDRGAGSGSSKQIGLTNVSVSAGATLLIPSMAGPNLLAETLTSTSAEITAEVTADGGAAITERGFVYSLTATNDTPTIGGSGVTLLVDPATTVDQMMVSLSGLASSSEYSIRGYATNSVGTSYTPVLTFTTLTPPPSFVSSYTQGFDDFTGTLPAGWMAISSGGVNGYAGTWGPSTSSGGLIGGVSNPGVLGYQHVGSSGILTVTLLLKNDSGNTLSELYVGYRGRVSRVTEARHPAWDVTVAGIPASSLGYSTASGVDETKGGMVTGLNILPDEVFTITWVSDRGTNASGSSRQIGIEDVVVALEPPVANDFDTWAGQTGATGGMTGDGDFDGLDNAFEYAFGLNPTSGGSVDPFVVPFNPATGLFTYTRRKQSLTGLAYTYQYSTALSTPWTNFTPAVPPVSNNGDPVEQITVTVPAALLAEPKLFIRVVTP